VIAEIAIAIQTVFCGVHVNVTSMTPLRPGVTFQPFA
jgi:hypothetical protein